MQKQGASREAPTSTLSWRELCEVRVLRVRVTAARAAREAERAGSRSRPRASVPCPYPPRTGSARACGRSRCAMSRRYDSRTTIFSPEGRLYQVEYAMEAISHAGTAIGILASDGIVLAAEKKLTSKLLEPTKSSEKMYMIDEHIAVAVAGITADANILINQARMHAQRYRFAFQEQQPVEQLVQTLCDEKQAYTQYGGLRPFGVSMLYAGWDKT